MRLPFIAIILYLNSIDGSDSCHERCVCLESYVDCSLKGFSEIPSNLPAWMKTLDVSNNSLRDHDISHQLSIYKYLSKIKLDNNGLTAIPISNTLQNLSTLSVTRNKINKIKSDFWNSVPSLTSLDLSENEIVAVNDATFPTPTQLLTLNLNSNRITQVASSSLYVLKRLNDLRLSRNNLSNLKKENFKLLLNLKKLDLSKNLLTTIEGLTFTGLDKLKILKIRQNSVFGLQDGAFYGLHSLQVLRLDHNSLKNVSKKWTYGLEALQELYLNNNKIQVVEEDSWEACEHLLHLDLSNNEINSVFPSTFKRLVKLQKLKLDYNSIAMIAEGAFNATPNLKVLELNQNHISWIIEDMSGAFYGLKHLYKLGLAANQITSINKNAFAGLSSLRELDLSKNYIKTIQENAFNRMPLTSLLMNTSSLLCDCSLAWLPMWLSSSSVQTSQVFCAYPEALKGKPLSSVPLQDFLCSENDSPKPIITEGPSSTVVISGNDVRLTCKAWSSDNSSLNFKWKRNNGDVLNQQSLIVNNTASLVFSPVLPSHAGKYQCIVSNHFGTAYSDKAALTVLVLPVMIKKPSNGTVRAGSTVKLECAASGEPTPQVSWQKDGGNVEFPAAQERRMHVMLPTDDVFYIVNAKPADSGLYSCIAKNSAGTVTANASLTVLEAPSFVKKMKDREVSIGQSTVLECYGNGWPKPKLRWWKDSVSLVMSPKHIFTADDQLLVIVDVDSADAGLYQCEITNSLGTEKSSAQLIIGPAFSASAEDITGVIIITAVCCAVGTSAIWVIIIYQTRKSYQGGKVVKSMTNKTSLLDNKSENSSSSSKDSGTGDSTKRSTDDVRPENIHSEPEYQMTRDVIVPDAALPLLCGSKSGSSRESPDFNGSHCCCDATQLRQHTRNNHDRCSGQSKYARPCSVPDDKSSPTLTSVRHHNSYICLYVSPKPTQV